MPKTNYKHGMKVVEWFLEVAKDKPVMSDWDKEILAAIIQKIMYCSFEFAVFEMEKPPVV